MRKIAENIYEHNGKRAKVMPLSEIKPPVCDACPWHSECEKTIDCQEHIGNSHVFVEIKENSHEEIRIEL